ncbi:MAG TPA: zinc ribbon domain-containing protein [Acidobacteriaceae bacterium]|nr:zinc ribbon domain-containing protein [Acidobacteriaceae bacterium]
MPLYEYRCKECGHQFEKIQSFSAPDEKECPVCKGPVERLISAPAIQFKGAGWYVTDYAGKGGSKTSKASDNPSTESKPAAPEAKPSAPSSDGGSGSKAPSSSTKSE